MSASQAKSNVAADVLEAFERKIEREQDMVYGVALFFECLGVLHAGQPAIIETYRKQYRNIIRSGNSTVDRARQLLDAARTDRSRVKDVAAFTFDTCQDHPVPADMVRRAELLISAYRRLFPERPLSEEFSSPELLRVMEAASDSLAGAK